MSKYVLLMEKYKLLRQDDPQEAQKLLEEAMRMVKDGEVSDKEIEGGAYI